MKLRPTGWRRPGSPGEDATLYDAVHAVGMELCPALGIAIPVGKDSHVHAHRLGGAGERKAVTAPLSLIVSAFAPVRDVRQTLTPQLRTDAGDTRLVLIDLARGRQPPRRLGARAGATRRSAPSAPDVDDPALLRGFFAAIQELNARGRCSRTTTAPTAACCRRCARWPSPATAAWTWTSAALGRGRRGGALQRGARRGAAGARRGRGARAEVLARHGLGARRHELGRPRGGAGRCACATASRRC